jgi:hypothetical protein
MRHRSRLLRLEEYQRRRLPPNHFMMSVRVPWDLPDDMDQEAWLREGVLCTCGERGCPELRIGLVLPEKAPSAEVWAQRAQEYYARRGDRGA